MGAGNRNNYDTDLAGNKVAQQPTINAGYGASAAKIFNQTNSNKNLTSSQKGSIYDSLKSSSGIDTANTLYNAYTKAYTPTGGGVPDYLSQLYDLFAEQNEAARQSALDAILSNLESVKGTYKNQIQQVMDEYGNLINENELKKERARQVVRENQANRGQLDSGLGRQEQLQLNSDYDSQTTNLEAARTKAVNDIYSLIAQAESEAAQQRANVNNTYQNALLQWKLSQ